MSAASPWRSLRVAAASVFAAALLAGCTPGATPTSQQLDVADSPLSREFYSVSAPSEQDETDAQQRRQEEAIASCMAGEGFDYVPVDYAAWAEGYEVDDPDLKYATRPWVERWGFGFSTVLQPAEPGGPVTIPRFVDDNVEYREGLSESELTAYFAALDEAQSDADDTHGGCRGRAEQEFPITSPTWQTAQYSELIAGIGTMWEQLRRSPERQELDAEWAACMADLGHPEQRDRDERAAAIEGPLNAVYADADPATGEVDADQLGLVQQQEIELAIADFDCEERTDYDQRYLRLQFAAEERFIGDNRTAIDELIAAYEQGQQ